MTKKIVLAGACRTAIGSMGGSLSTVSAADLGAKVIREAVCRAGISLEQIDHVYMGNVIQAGQGQNVARQAAMKAGLPKEVPAVTINVVCGSGLQCVNLAAQMIKAGDADIVVAGGTENMSQAPYLLDQGRYGYRLGNGQIKDALVIDALWDAFYDYHMGITAENIAVDWGLTRAEQDGFAYQSQMKAARALKNNTFGDEIVSVEIKGKKGTISFSIDESPRADTTLELMGKLKPAFKAEGTVTAANSSTINDGAAALIVMSEEKAKELGVDSMAYYEGGLLAGVDPRIMGIGPVQATKKLLQKLDMKMADIDLIEANEAFAAQSLAVKKELNIPDHKINVNGGAIALGHPVGASGARILVTLLHEMQRRSSSTGLASLCIGGGLGCSVIVRR